LKTVQGIAEFIGVLAALFGIIFFFCLVGFKRPFGGWSNNNPVGCAAIMAGVITVSIFLWAGWNAIWGRDAGLAAAISIVVVALAIWCAISFWRAWNDKGPPR
jgi:hypothetical protein